LCNLANFQRQSWRTVPDIQDFDNFFGGAVDHRLGKIPGSGGIVLLDAFNNGFELAGRFGRPPNQPHE
jgi:hypothetical protein